MTRAEPIKVLDHAYMAHFRPEPEGGYTVSCPALPGLVSYGATLDEARAMAADAMAGYLECLREDGEAIPPSDAPALAEPAPLRRA